MKALYFFIDKFDCDHYKMIEVILREDEISLEEVKLYFSLVT
jgi:hypothetical protein